MKGAKMARKIFYVIILSLPSIACAQLTVEKALVVKGAYELQKHTFADGKARQIYYKVNLKYPDTTLTDHQFRQLKKLGWSRCSGYREGWDSYVDAAEGEGHEKTIHQNNTYWSKDNKLLLTTMRYYSRVTKSKRRLRFPDKTVQHVVILIDSDPGMQKHLGISCE